MNYLPGNEDLQHPKSPYCSPWWYCGARGWGYAGMYSFLAGFDTTEDTFMHTKQNKNIDSIDAFMLTKCNSICKINQWRNIKIYKVHWMNVRDFGAYK